MRDDGVLDIIDFNQILPYFEVEAANRLVLLDPLFLGLAGRMRLRGICP